MDATKERLAVSREIIEERWRAALWRPARFVNETGYSPVLTKLGKRIMDSLDELAATMLGSEVQGDELENAHAQITDELLGHLNRRLVDWADETLNRADEAAA